MEKKTFARELAPGQIVSDVFVISEARSGQARNGPFWSLKFEDVSGSIEAKVWSPLSQELRDLKPGSLAYVEGGVGSFRDQPQINVERLEILESPPEDLDMAQLIATSQVAPQDSLRQIEELCASLLTHKPWRKFCRKVLNDPEIRAKLIEAPGAKSMHHAYRGGLLEHTLAVARLCLSICANYPSLDRETLLAAAIFHDLGKAWELSSGLSRDYTAEGRLMGHIMLGQEILRPFLDKASGLTPDLKLHFKHILVSHHGEYEFGSPKRPKTAEAFVLHFADNLDAKLNMVLGAFAEDEEPGQAWSPYMRSLERQVFNPVRLQPEADEPDKSAKPEKKDEQLCLLPLKE